MTSQDFLTWLSQCPTILLNGLSELPMNALPVERLNADLVETGSETLRPEPYWITGSPKRSSRKSRRLDDGRPEAWCDAPSALFEPAYQ
jgi:hypothetical protein